MIRYKLDPSTTSVVGLCREPGCGFRSLAASRDEARRVRDEHEAAMHMVRGRHARPRRDANVLTKLRTLETWDS